MTGAVRRPGGPDGPLFLHEADRVKTQHSSPSRPAGPEEGLLPPLQSVLHEHQGAIYGYLRSRLVQAADAEDLTQEVFLRWHQTRHRFDPTQRLRPWLLGIARLVLLEHLKRVQNRKEVAWTELCLELEQLIDFRDDEARYADVLPHLPGCFEEMGPSARQALELRYRSNLSLAAIAEELRRSEGAVKLLMFRARQALKECLARKLNHANAPAAPKG
jgi:RNA polymerase sigma-70 factor (ECF subfamily)